MIDSARNHPGFRWLCAVVVVLCGAARAQQPTGSPGGLGTAGSQLWSLDRDDLPGTPVQFDAFGLGLAAGDFDGDGYDDLAIGIPRREVLTTALQQNAGVVLVLFGSAHGITAAGHEIFDQSTSGVQGNAEAEDRFGWCLAAGNFNGDAYEDLAIGAPGEAVGAGEDEGAVVVAFGSANGLLPATSQLIHQDSPGVFGVPESGDIFGCPLAVGNFDGDAYDDLAIGIPGEDLDSTEDAGAVQIASGSAAGLVAKPTLWTQEDDIDMEMIPEMDDRAGGALAAGRYDSDIYSELFIGVAGEDDEDTGQNNEGMVNMLFGEENGPTSVSYRSWGGSAAGDGAGRGLTTGDFDGDGDEDVAIGSPGANDARGEVRIREFLSQSHLIDQDSPSGLPDSASDNDNFGEELAAGDFDNDGRDDLVVGVAQEDIVASGMAVEGSALSSAGAINVFYGEPGLTTVGTNRAQFFSRDSRGMRGAADTFEFLGVSLAVGDFNADGHDDLAAAASGARFPEVEQSGAVYVLYGSLFADDFENGDLESWSGHVP